MLAGHFIPSQFAVGTVIAEIGLFLVAAYYLTVWRRLKNSPQPPFIPDSVLPPEKLPWPELRFLTGGIVLSVVFYMLAAASDGRNSWPIVLAHALMGLCAALFFAMFAVGFVSLFNLWNELVLQLRNAQIRSLFLFFPLAIFWLLVGLAVMILIGGILANIPRLPEVLRREVLWSLLGIAFYRLWMSRSHGALMLRAILMVLFSSIMVAAAAFAYWWIVRQTALLLVVFLSGIGIANAVFYSRWVRTRALQRLLMDGSEPRGMKQFEW